MAMAAVYTTVNGIILSETRGGTETVYVPDTLGSLAECRDSSGTKTFSAEYWPYGEVQTSTGTSTSPWGFVGLLGYLKDLANLLYVRARHYRPGYARWQTVDSLWPEELVFVYAIGQPLSLADPSGNQADPHITGSCPDPNAPPPLSFHCILCAIAIIAKWWNTRVHHENPDYIHCRACCELARLFDGRCAMTMQEIQNETPYFKGKPAKQRARIIDCKQGIKFAYQGKDCHRSCLGVHPPFPGVPSTNLPLPSLC